MVTRLNISFDSDLLEQISAEFDLRAPNRQALRQLIFTLDGDYDPKVMQVLNLATGVGKTYLMAAFVEYLRRQGVGNVMIVTPGKTVQAKTIQNFTPGSPRRNSHPVGKLRCWRSFSISSTGMVRVLGPAGLERDGFLRL